MTCSSEHIDANGTVMLKLVSKQNPHVAYTIGAERAYDEALLDASDPPKKLGKQGDDYEGGWVWRDASMARAFIGSPKFCAAFGDRDHAPVSAVYELELPGPWEASVSANPSVVDGVHRLLLSARIVRKVTDVM